MYGLVSLNLQVDFLKYISQTFSQIYVEILKALAFALHILNLEL